MEQPILSTLLDPRGNLNGFNNPFGPATGKGEVNIYLENKNWVEQLGDRLIGWLDTQVGHFVDWVIPTMKGFAVAILDQGITLFQVAIIGLVVFNVYKIIANYKREEAIEKTYIWGLVFVLTVFYKAVCVNF